MDVRDTLAQPTIHEHWEDRYRTAENEQFYEQAFDVIAAHLKKGTVLDVGCGIGAHSDRLARRGFRVVGVDVSDWVVAQARRAHPAITFQREDITALSFPDRAFDHVICWGVLMHVPDVDRALAELVRVVKPGGYLVISEGNAASVQAVFGRIARWALRRTTGVEIKRMPAGIEGWHDTPDGPIVARHAHIRWLTRWLTAHGATVRSLRAGQFTEVYARFAPGAAQRMIHHWNHFWFRYVRWSGPAFGNLIIARKQ